MTDYQHAVDKALKRIEDGLEEVDPDDVDCTRAGDVLTLTFRDKRKCILNTQRPTSQLWLAFGARAWHFDREGETWVDDKDETSDLFATLREIVRQGAGINVSF